MCSLEKAAQAKKCPQGFPTLKLPFWAIKVLHRLGMKTRKFYLTSIMNKWKEKYFFLPIGCVCGRAFTENLFVASVYVICNGYFFTESVDR